MLPPHLVEKVRHRESAETALSLERLAGPRNAQLASELAFEMHVRCDVDVADHDPGPLACESGCSSCCLGGNVEVTIVEAIAIADHLRTSLDADGLNALTARVRADAADTRARTIDERFIDAVACPLLNQNEGACIAYEHRPSNCRGWTSYDASKCKQNVSRPQYTQVLSNAYIQATNAAGMLGLATAIESAGLDERSFQLGTALEVALCEPNAAARWASGEKLFDAAKAHAKGEETSEAKALLGKVRSRRIHK